MATYHAGLEQIRSELHMVENTLRRVMEDPDLLRSLGNNTSAFLNVWRNVKGAQTDIDYMRIVMSTHGSDSQV
jgi:hypothetical protein